jgi:hypothetical protein
MGETAERRNLRHAVRRCSGDLIEYAHSGVRTQHKTGLRIKLPVRLQKISERLRSDGVRVHPGMPFGFLPEYAFSFAGIPIDSHGDAISSTALPHDPLRRSRNIRFPMIANIGSAITCNLINRPMGQEGSGKLPPGVRVEGEAIGLEAIGPPVAQNSRQSYLGGSQHFHVSLFAQRESGMMRARVAGRGHPKVRKGFGGPESACSTISGFQETFSHAAGGQDTQLHVP